MRLELLIQAISWNLASLRYCQFPGNLVTAASFCLEELQRNRGDLASGAAGLVLRASC